MCFSLYMLVCVCVCVGLQVHVKPVVLTILSPWSVVFACIHYRGLPAAIYLYRKTVFYICVLYLGTLLMCVAFAFQYVLHVISENSFH